MELIDSCSFIFNLNERMNNRELKRFKKLSIFYQIKSEFLFSKKLINIRFGLFPMDKDQILGVIIFIGSIVGIIVYFALIFFINPMLTLQVSAFLAVAAFLVIMAWIGYTLATTPPPKPIEEIEKEIESETKKLEEETKAETKTETKQEEKKES